MLHFDDLRRDLHSCYTAEDFADEPTDLHSQPTMRLKTSHRSGPGGPGLLRYPGGKTKLVRTIAARLESFLRELSPSAEYREPFLGSGAVALSFLQHQAGRPAWINDRDPAMAALWDAVISRDDSLKLLIHLFPDVMDANYFYYYKKHLLSIVTPQDLGRYDPVWIGLAKLAVHQLSFSGLGTRAGGPMGGRTQGGRTGFHSRYNSDLLTSKISRCRDILSNVRLRQGTCTCLDFEDLLAAPGESMYYIDPPYYEAGPQLYQCSFRHEDHERLAALLRKECRPWLLCYDSHAVILDLYSGWSHIEEILVPYSINGCGAKVELLISG
jgi:DNA adenine methylase